jgi:hypothetical protein
MGCKLSARTQSPSEGWGRACFRQSLLSRWRNLTLVFIPQITGSDGSYHTSTQWRSPFWSFIKNSALFGLNFDTSQIARVSMLGQSDLISLHFHCAPPSLASGCIYVIYITLTPFILPFITMVRKCYECERRDSIQHDLNRPLHLKKPTAPKHKINRPRFARESRANR